MGSQITVGENDTLVVRCDFQKKNIPKSFGARWNKSDKTWHLPFTTYNLNGLMKKLPGLKISNGVKKTLEQQQSKERKLATMVEDSKQNQDIRFRVPGVKLSLYNFQKFGVLFAITNNDGVLIADQMGLGKTVQAIATSCYKKHKGEADECLVITPASLKWNWPLEIEKFTDEKYVVIDGKPKQRVDQWLGRYVCIRDETGKVNYVAVKKERPFFYIVNFELVVEDLFGGKKYDIKEDDNEDQIERKVKLMEAAEERAKQLQSIREKVWSIVSVDECHALKRHSSRRTREIKKLRGTFRMGLSGTPMDGKLEELHSVMQFVKPGLFEAKQNFLMKHAEFDFWGRIVRYKHIDEVKERIKPFFIRRLKQEVLEDLPEKTYENRYVTLSSEEMTIYKKLASRGHEATEDAEAIVAVIRCKQFCDSPGLIDIDTKRSSKMLEFLDVIDEIVIQNSCKVLVFSQYARMNEIIMGEMDKLGIKYLYIWSKTPAEERAAMQKTFEIDDSLDMIIGTDAMSLGLNFTPADYVINYDDAWSPSTMEQREDRAHRLGRKDAVTVVNFVCRNTIEERIRGVLYSKSAVSAETLGDDIDEVVLKRLGPKDIAKLL
jgi:SNF2 family DNA or RNA helicase